MKRNPKPVLERGSFRDPSGFVFHRDGHLYRQVNQSYADSYDLLIASGFFQELMDRKLLIHHREVDIPAPQADLAYKILEPDLVEFISYPYEWTFGQLKDAALLTLEAQKMAVQAGMSLKDASAYNVQFHQGRPILIDSLSFEPIRVTEPWVAYRQFCQHFLAPLALMAYRDVRLAKLARLSMEGIPLDLASQLLPARTRLSITLVIHLHMHARAQRRFAGERVSDKKGGRQMSRSSHLGLLASLEGAVRGLEWKGQTTDWSDYETTHGYSDRSLTAKAEAVGRYIELAKPSLVWDLGANTGRFSRLSSSRSIPTVAFDFDYGAVETDYQRAKRELDGALLPLVLDLANPSPDLGWAGAERQSLARRGPADLLLALALVHHLAIGNNVPLGMIASYFSVIGRDLVVEFVPKTDPQVQRLLANREDVFSEYSIEGFESAFRRHFDIQASGDIPGSDRRIYWMKRQA